LAVPANLRDDLGVERHIPPAVSRLRRLDPSAHERAPHPHARFRPVEAQVPPLERDQLRHAEPGRGEQPEHRPVARVDHGQERGEVTSDVVIERERKVD